MRAVEAALGRVGAYDLVASASHRLLKPHLVERRRRLLAFHAPLVHAGDLVFDVGANDGRLTRIYRALGARVVAVEPNAQLAARLLRRYRVTVEPVALGAEDGEADLYLASEDVLSTLSADWIARTRSGGIPIDWTGESVRVRVTTVDRLIAEHGVPDYLKIDVEGFEPQVLAGLSRPIRLVSFEFQVANADAAAACVERLERLGRYEYRYTVMDELEFRGGWDTPERVPGWIAATRDAHGVGANGDVFARLL